MQTREIVSIVIQSVFPVIAAAFALLMARLTKAAVQYFNSKTAAVLLDALAVHVDAAAAEVEATLVRDLKDPSKPGTWNEISQATAKAAVVKMVHESAPELVRGVSKAMLSQMIEKSVSRLPESAAKPAVGNDAVTERLTAVAAEAMAATYSGAVTAEMIAVSEKISAAPEISAVAAAEAVVVKAAESDAGENKS
jgi:hypothetical protein